MTATWPTVGGMATPTNAVDSWTKKPRQMDSRLGMNAAMLMAAPRKVTAAASTATAIQAGFAWPSVPRTFSPETSPMSR